MRGWAISIVILVGLVWPALAQPTQEQRSQGFLAWLARSDVEVVEAAKALRRLNDPASRAVMEAWTTSADPRVRREAWLGLAALREPAGLSFETLATLVGERTAERSALLDAALSAGLVDARTRRRLQSLPGLTDGERLQLVIADWSVGGSREDVEALRRLLRGEHRTRAALAAVLLHDAGEPAGTEALAEMVADPEGGDWMFGDIGAAVNLVAQLHLSSSGGLVLSLANDAQDPGLQRRALRAALAAGVPGAGRAFAEAMHRAAGDSAERLRLALLALGEWPTTPNTVAEDLAADNDATLARIGHSMRLLANPHEATPAQHDAVAQLIQLQHPPIDAAFVRALEHPRASNVSTSVLKAAMDRRLVQDQKRLRTWPDTNAGLADEMTSDTDAWIAHVAFSPETLTAAQRDRFAEEFGRRDASDSFRVRLAWWWTQAGLDLPEADPASETMPDDR